MRHRPSWRFLIAADFALLSATLCLFTLFVPDWIEAVFRVDPDQHSGSLEWLITATFLLTTAASILLARREWHRMALSLSRAP